MAHQECFNLSMKVISNTKKENLNSKAKEKAQNSKRNIKIIPIEKSVSDLVSEEEYRSKLDFYNYVRKLLRVESLSPKFYALSTKYARDYDINWNELKLCFEWFYELKGQEIIDEGIGIIPYIIDESRMFWKLKDQIEQSNKIIERIIKASSNEGDLVADFYMGSGTTAEVCKDLNRKFIGCDINPKAVELSKVRCGVFINNLV